MEQRIPIVIGVTGHRDLAPGTDGALYGHLRDLFLALQKRYPASPIVVLSPLAAGADTLCARAALDAGCALAAPLPLPPDEYRKDFTPGEAAVFDVLSAEAQDCFVAPDTEPRPARPTRGWHYRQAGLYVAAHCHLLLALWDGEPQLTEDGCGTYETVRQMLGGDLEGLAASAPAGKCGPLIQIVTPRAAAGKPPKEPAFWLHQPGCAPVSRGGFPALDVFRDIDDFNWEIKMNLHWVVRERESCVAGCIDPGIAASLDGSQQALLGAFAAADTLAVHNQQKRLRVVQALSAIALLLVLSFLFYDEAASFAALVVYGLLLLPAAAVYFLSARRKYHEKYLRFRTLAETLRVQFYLRLAGIAGPWLCIPAWRRERPVTFVENAAAGFIPLPPQNPRPDDARRFWVNGQLGYHRRSLQKKGTKNRLNERASLWLLLAAVLFYFVVLLLEIFAPGLMARSLVALPGFAFGLSGLTKIILGALFAAAAFLSNYYGKLDLPRQMGSDEKMATLFEMAEAALARHEGDPGARREILLELARAHADESISWFVYQSGNAPEFIID